MNRQPRLTRKLAALLDQEAEHGGRAMALVRVLRALELDWDELLLALSNLAVFERDRVKTGRKQWHRRACLLHQAMEKERSRKAARKQAQQAQQGRLFA